MVHGVNTAFTDLALGHKLNFVTACGLLVWQFISFVVIPMESVSVVRSEPATCGARGEILSKSTVAERAGPNCALSDTIESCVVDPASGVTDCVTGYVPGDAAAPSTTCPAGCTFTAAVSAAGSSCSPLYEAGQSGEDYTECVLSGGGGVCDWVPPTDCQAFFRAAAPSQLEYNAMEIHMLQKVRLTSTLLPLATHSLIQI